MSQPLRRGDQRRQSMTEAGWIIREAIARAMKEYDLSYAELVGIVASELQGWGKEQLREEWGEPR